MIFVITGTHSQQFNRLLKEVDNLVEFKAIKDKVIMQIGYSDYLPKNTEWFKFVDYKKMLNLIGKASLIITHGGIGSVMVSLKLNKKIIVVPRLKKFLEHTNDHQLEIVKELSRQGKIVAVYNINELRPALANINSFMPKKSEKSGKILQMINLYLNRLESESL